MADEPIRFSVVLSKGDNCLLLALRSAIEQRTQKKTSLADVVREALATQAKAEGVEVISAQAS